MFLLAVLLATSACNQSKPKEETTASKEVIDTTGAIPMDELETETIAVDERPSDVHLLTALNDFSQKKNAEAAQQLQEGIDALKEETANYKAASKQPVEQTLALLDTLRIQVKEGKLTRIEPLQKAVAKAQNLVAHNVFYAVEETLVTEKQSATALSLTTAINQLKQAVEKDKSALKKEGETLLKEGQNLEAQLKKGEKVEQTQLKAYTSRCHQWLEKHD